MRKIIFPRAFAFAVDDLGWNEGSDLSIRSGGGPHRAGVKRIFDVADYEALVKVGSSVGARIQGLFILSEFDRENILATCPTSTFQREKWNNRLRVNDQQRLILDYVRQQAAYLEFGFHGTGHEYWAPGEAQKRAEWYNLADRRPWPEASLRDHIECFKKIMAQYGLSTENGHSFPESFAPCAYSYYWNPSGAYSLGKLLKEAGVKYANTDFSQIPELNPPSDVNGGGFDFGTHVINRLNYGNPWYALASLPITPLAQQQTDVIEAHWPNWLAQDDFLQPEITEKWINYYQDVQKTQDRYVAKNTEQLHSQWLYKRYTTLNENNDNSVLIDNCKMPEDAYANNTLGNLVLKIPLKADEHVAEAKLDGRNIPGYFKEQGFGFLYLPRLDNKIYKLTYQVGTVPMDDSVWNDGTYNVYDVSNKAGSLYIHVRVYGTQRIKVRCKSVNKIESLSPNLKVRYSSHDQGEQMLHVEVVASDIQGSTGVVRVDVDS